MTSFDGSTPTELRDTARRLISKRDKCDVKILLSPILTIAEGAYSQIDDGCRHLTEKLRRVVEDIRNGDEIRFYRQPGRFDRLLREEVADTGRVLYTFPFFLTSSRAKTYFGVIPYARQTKVGVLLDRFHLFSQKILQHSSDIGSHQLADLIWETARAHGEIYYYEGYAVGEILMDYLKQVGNDELLLHFRQLLVKLPFDGNSASYIPDFMMNSQKAEHKIFVFDLADRQWVDQGLEKYPDKYRVITVPHGLEIPVGIGFTHTQALWLYEKKRYAELQAAATDTLSAYRDQLEEIGIEMMTQ